MQFKKTKCAVNHFISALWYNFLKHKNNMAFRRTCWLVSPRPDAFLLNSLSKLLIATICIIILRWVFSSKLRFQAAVGFDQLNLYRLRVSAVQVKK